MAHRELIVTFRLSSSSPPGVVAQRWKTRDRCVIGTLPKLVRSLYRLIALDGSPHPVLDAPYESMDAAEQAKFEDVIGDVGVVACSPSIMPQPLMIDGVSCAVVLKSSGAA